MPEELNEKTPARRGMCGRCYDDNVDLFPANCKENPEALNGAPLGQYHCPDCGAMVVAGIPHTDLCAVCLKREHPGFDNIKPTEEKEQHHVG
jgi:hypothetical protein